MTRLAVSLLVATAVAAACITRPVEGSPSVNPVEVAVYAAASLTAPMASVKTAYESSHRGIRLSIALDSSAALRTQIEQGAPADVFLSADVLNPQRLVDAGLATDPVTAFAGNRLIIAVPKSNPASIGVPADFARPGVRVVAAGENVPITNYASQLIERLAALPGYPAGFAAAYESNIVSREDNVKAVVAKLELGEGDAGIVYVTDASASDGIATVDIPPEAAVVATYGGVVVAGSPDARQAAEFLGWLAGPDGQAILAGFGFVSPG